jgi:hypothetical protein
MTRGLATRPYKYIFGRERLKQFRIALVAMALSEERCLAMGPKLFLVARSLAVISDSSTSLLEVGRHVYHEPTASGTGEQECKIASKLGNSIIIISSILATVLLALS